MECFSKIKLNKKENKKIPEEIFKKIINKNYKLLRWWNHHHMIYIYNNEIIEIYFKLYNTCINFELYNKDCMCCEMNNKIIEYIEIKYNNITYTTNNKYQMSILYDKFRHYNNFENFLIE